MSANAKKVVLVAICGNAVLIIDKLELRLREQCPRVSHVTIEVEGIAESQPKDKADG
jgi:hypothetical protein